jgi:hypothetical protein
VVGANQARKAHDYTAQHDAGQKTQSGISGHVVVDRIRVLPQADRKTRALDRPFRGVEGVLYARAHVIDVGGGMASEHGEELFDWSASALIDF